MDTLHFILTAYGMTFIIVYGKIFEDIRPKKDYTKKWNTLWNCPLCMGWWCSLFLFGINGFTELFTFEYSLANAFCLSCLGSGTTYLLSVLVNDFGLRVSPRTGGENVGD